MEYIEKNWPEISVPPPTSGFLPYHTGTPPWLSKWPVEEVLCKIHIAKRPCYCPFRIMPSCNIDLIGVVN
jgi:hypothetical protein